MIPRVCILHKFHDRIQVELLACAFTKKIVDQVENNKPNTRTDPEPNTFQPSIQHLPTGLSHMKTRFISLCSGHPNKEAGCFIHDKWERRNIDAPMCCNKYNFYAF